ncbi:electron transfer flavoprotein subunit alpha/FixB family protein [Aidingimonas halophila]|uniref:Electron transfer flavoprotein alpha subunit apoprotein n=1 Tax=Aidingimonas halophila TaxID=574349 RepID=A0A1H2UDQ8_9GAMM|nr:electron transfer flavoprotein subunit alpha/FixB family protein [Aidingimonas halophila]GHC22440.1 electron transfer flavoprotein subunit alpha [Aidingimonas halophila]SDW53604.1 electron transfer flavoprotein alpha subunit apoprotein [Aidingimonas halophila]
MTLPRRDPRQERIVRNRRHPEHDRLMDDQGAGAAMVTWTGPSGVRRCDPHRCGFIGPNGIKRIDRGGSQQPMGNAAPSAGRQQPTAQRRHIEIESPAFLVTVVPDMPGGRLSSHDRDLLGLARQLADADAQSPGAVLAIVMGAHKETQWGDAGVDRLMECGDSALEGYAPEARLGALEAVERELAPRFWLLPDAATGGADLGRRLAARLGERPVTGLWSLESAPETAQGWRCTTRGGAGSLDIQRPLSRVILALEECAEPVSETHHAASVLTLSHPLLPLLSRIEDQGRVPVDPASIALAEAEFILSAGNGVKDWEGFHHAARVLGATEGASRVAVDDGFMARDRQVGATGTWVTARVYVAVGISGAIQHLQGIQRCDKVVAINKDPDCDMIKRADLAVIGDAGEILSALVARVEQEREEQRDAA